MFILEKSTNTTDIRPLLTLIMSAYDILKDSNFELLRSIGKINEDNIVNAKFVLMSYEFNYEVDDLFAYLLTIYKRYSHMKIQTLRISDIIKIMQDQGVDKMRAVDQKIKLVKSEVVMMEILLLHVMYLFMYGKLEQAGILCELIKPVLDNIIPNNDHGELNVLKIYFEMCHGFLTTITLPLPLDLPRIYLLGDSHSLPLAWRTINIADQKYLIQPLHIRGAKIWNFRKESKHLTKTLFNRYIESLPPKSILTFALGELDIRSFGTSDAIRKKYNINHVAYVNTLMDIYRTIITKVADIGHQIYLHPVCPCLDAFRGLLIFMSTSIKELNTQAKYLDFLSHLLTKNPLEGKFFSLPNMFPTRVNAQYVKKEYYLDFTHLNPNYIELFEAAFNC